MPVIVELKRQILKLLDSKFWPSVESFHWVACALDVGYRRLSFVVTAPGLKVLENQE